MFQEVDTKKIEKLEIGVKALILVLMVLCFYHMPYEYYVFQRRISFVLFLMLLVTDSFLGKYLSLPISLFCVVLFNPFLKFGLTGYMYDRIEMILILLINIWIIIDIRRLFFYPKKKKSAIIKRHFHFDNELGVYVIYNSGYVYEVKPNLIDHLKNYLEEKYHRTIYDWHCRLNEEQKQFVRKRIRRSEDRVIKK